MKYDDSTWHSEGDFPTELPPEAGATHIGMFLAWAVLTGLESEEFLDDFGDEIEALRARETTPGAFLENLDGKLTAEELSSEGNAFAGSYYEKQYFADYTNLLAGGLPSAYHVPDTWAAFDTLPKLDARFAAWKSAGG